MFAALGRRRGSLLYITASCALFLYGFIASVRKDLSISIMGDVTYPWQRIEYDEYNCGCPRSGPPIRDSENESLCSDWSSSRGPGQRVVSYTIYGDMSRKQVYKQYFTAIEDRIKDVHKHYKGWIMRLYHNTSTSDSVAHALLCRLYCQYPTLDPCQVNHIYHPSGTQHHSLQPTLEQSSGGVPFNSSERSTKQERKEDENEKLVGNIENEERDSGTIPKNSRHINRVFSNHHKGSRETERKSYGKVLVGKMWRFLPMADPLVSEFLIRDVDSAILPREVAAVDQWLANSTALVHIMRDHPSHNGLILAGMWGGSRSRGGAKLTSLLSAMAHWPPRDLWDYDQMLLRREVWPEVLDSVLAHDSYFCANPHFQSRHRSAPFPTRRKGRYFVGWGPLRDHELPSITICPPQCRPPHHQDWTLC